MENYVVIDLGSNSVRLRITNIADDGTLTVTHQLKEYVRLSENMGQEKTLKQEPIKRTLQALKSFKDIYSKLENPNVNAIATAAVRQAANQKDFLDLVKKKLDLEFNVITGEREAYLDFLGVTKTLPVKDCLIMDTGGASTELILAKNGQVQNLISLPFGSVTISAAHHLDDKISARHLFDAMTSVEKELTNVDWLTEAHKIPLICLGGSNRTLAKIARRREFQAANLPELHGYRLPSDKAFEIIGDLIDMDKKQRESVPGLAKSRADVVVGGLTPLVLILRTCHIDEILFSNHGLREGSLFEYLENKKQLS